MIVRSQLKAIAKQQIKGKLGAIVLCGVVYMIINTIISEVVTQIRKIILPNTVDLSDNFTYTVAGGVAFSPFDSLQNTSFSTAVTVIYAGAFTLAFAQIYLAITTQNKPPRVPDLFSGFKGQIYGKTIALYGLTLVFTILWTMLFIIPGIIAGIRYSQAFYILAQNPELSAREALNSSKKLMKGHIGEFFVLGISFFPWLILGVCTFGIAFIWVVPYMSTTYANYYLSITGQYAIQTSAEPEVASVGQEFAPTIQVTSSEAAPAQVETPASVEEVKPSTDAPFETH